MVRNWLGNGAWSLPGGGAHVDETIEGAAVRELDEEIGVTIVADELTPFHHGTWSSNGFSYDYYCSFVSVGNLKIKKRLFEITDTRYFSFDEARAHSHVAPEITRAITRLRVLLAETTP